MIFEIDFYPRPYTAVKTNQGVLERNIDPKFFQTMFSWIKNILKASYRSSKRLNPFFPIVSFLYFYSL